MGLSKPYFAIVKPTTRYTKAMRLTFLGTSAGIPTRSRNTTALALALDDAKDWYLIDCGEATQHQLLKTQYSAARLKAVFITHVHGDHCYGLPGLIASAHMQGRTAPLTICAPDGIEQMVRAVIAHTDLSHLRYPLNFIRSDKAGFEYSDQQINVNATELSHRVPCFAYNFLEKPKKHLNGEALRAIGLEEGPAWGQLIKGETVNHNGQLIEPATVLEDSWSPRKVIIGGDNDKPELLDNELKTAQLMVHEATFTEDVFAANGGKYQHSTAAMVARAAEQQKLPYLILTHFSQRYRADNTKADRTVGELQQEAKALYTGKLCLARDLQSYYLDRDHQLHQIEQD